MDGPLIHLPPVRVADDNGSLTSRDGPEPASDAVRIIVKGAQQEESMSREVPRMSRAPNEVASVLPGSRLKGVRSRRGRVVVWLLGGAVLVPGYAVGSSYQVPLASRLAEACPRLRAGASGARIERPCSRPLTIPELALALAAWMEASEMRSALLVGHSLGCQVAAEVATERPELVAGLVLIGPASDPEARTAARHLARGVVASIFDHPTYLMGAARDYFYFRAGAQVRTC